MAQYYIPNNHQMENGHHSYDNRSGWRYQSCECCPYGYHIDLDFVRYCDAIKERADYTGSINKRRERRRQRQSMEVMLGLLPPAQIASVPSLTKTAEITSPLVHTPTTFNTHIQSALVQDALGDVVTDFERTLERSTGSSNIFDLSPDTSRDAIYRVSSNTSVFSNNSNIVNNTSINSTVYNVPTTYSPGIIDDTKGASACTLKNIRKQMALGLERMRELEEQVKLIPALQVQISVLKDEKRILLEQIKNKVDGSEQKSFVLRKDMGVMCGVLSRTIGVGPQYPRLRDISTETIPLEPQIIVRDRTPPPSPVSTERSSQTERPRLLNSYVQTKELVKMRVTNVGVEAKPDSLDSNIQVSYQTRTVGVSSDTVLDKLCNKCNVVTCSIGVGPIAASDNFLPISLKSLSVPRSKSFNLGEEKLDHKASKHRTIGCQTEMFLVNRACQYEPKVSTRACQYEFTKKSVTKGVQYDSHGFVNTQQTDTNGLSPPGKDAHTNTVTRYFSDATCNTIKVKLADAFSNTKKVSVCNASINTTETLQSIEKNLEKKIKEEKKDEKEDTTSTVSRIPRLAQSPGSERHKLKRQDTYTKIPAAAPPLTIGLSGIDLTPSTTNSSSTANIVESECSTSFSKAKSNYHIPEISSASSQINNVSSSENRPMPTTNAHPLAPPESALLNTIDRSSRQKAVPSKEMLAAMKVLNDSLEKSKHSATGMSNGAKSHLKNALNIIQQEWFKVSSIVNANPLDVEDYLDKFEEISSSLLLYIVNMTDDSGNTAMHYAVSHGNFDVVSILLDSKVCNINKPNLAGYTSVMLVSLTQVCSSTDAQVVRRLFQLADVNVRAKQHGQTALMLAVSHGRLDMVQMLLEAGADINIQDEDGSTALMCAAEHGHIDIVKYFLSHPECDSTIVDVDGSTALKIALEAGHKDIGVLLYAHGHSVHGVSGFSSQRKTKSTSAASSNPVSRSPSRGAYDNKHSK